jgi:cytochrome c oxidase subunit 2
MIFILWACIAITAAVFGVMIYSIATFPKAQVSPAKTAATFRHSTLVEILWAIVPILILVGMATPAVKTFVMTGTKSEVSHFAAGNTEGK